MSAEKRMLRPALKRGALIGIAVVLVIAGIGYAWFDYRFPSWKEEVLLPDGRKIIVRQRRDFIEGYGTRKTWLTFSLPEMGGEQTWSEYMQPILIGVGSDKKVYVVGWPSGEKQMSRYRHPRYGYVAFGWDSGAFERIPFMSVPAALRLEENVVRCNPGKDFLAWAEKSTHGCNEESVYLEGISRKIDLQQMEAWALARAKRNNIVPLSD